MRRKQNTDSSIWQKINQFELFSSTIGKLSKLNSLTWGGSTKCDTSVQLTDKNINLKFDVNKSMRTRENYRLNRSIALDEISEFRNMSLYD